MDEWSPESFINLGSILLDLFLCICTHTQIFTQIGTYYTYSELNIFTE